MLLCELQQQCAALHCICAALHMCCTASVLVATAVLAATAAATTTAAATLFCAHCTTSTVFPHIVTSASLITLCNILPLPAISTTMHFAKPCLQAQQSGGLATSWRWVISVEYSRRSSRHLSTADFIRLRSKLQHPTSCFSSCSTPFAWTHAKQPPAQLPSHLHLGQPMPLSPS